MLDLDKIVCDGLRAGGFSLVKRTEFEAMGAVIEAAERVCQLNLSGPMIAMDVMMEVSALRAALAKLEEQAK